MEADGCTRIRRQGVDAQLKLTPLPPPAPSLESEVYRRLRDLVVSGDLVPGALYSMNELAGQLRVSRTPVAQAAARLAEQGMVRVEHRRGMRILETSTHDLAEIYQIRLLLEPRATHRATGLMRATDHRRLATALDALGSIGEREDRHRDYVRRDADFHHVILQCSGNARLAGYVHTLRELQMMRNASTVDRTRRLSEVVADHARIHALIVERDADGAAAAMHRHIAVTYELLIAQATGAHDSGQEPWPPLLEPHRVD